VAPGMRLLRVLRIEGEASPLQEGGALSSWSPLRRPLFRTLWIAALASNAGAWIQDVGSAWLMTSLAPSPIMDSLLQTAASLPFFLLALPAGAVADIMDRRRVLLVAQGWMLGAAALLGEWVRARGLSLYLLMFMGGMAVGSTFWGLVAARAGMAFAFLCSGVGLLLSLAAAGRFRLPRERLDLTPSMHWSVPAPASDPQLDSGPVLVTIEYRVDPGKADEFAQAMQELGRVRRRDGAAFWGLYRDLSDPRRHVETFIVESWAEHVRQHGRATVEDRRVQERILAFHSGDGPPAVSHCIAEPRAA
jgi:quinol monooxygenase YgiN